MQSTEYTLHLIIRVGAVPAVREARSTLQMAHALRRGRAICEQRSLDVRRRRAKAMAHLAQTNEQSLEAFAQDANALLCGCVEECGERRLS